MRAGTRLLRALLAAALLGAATTVSLPPPAAAAPGRRCAPAAETVWRGTPWAQRRLDPQRVWMLARGRTVTVAVLDTGVSRSAPALAGRVLPGRDVRTGGRADDDCHGHGTFVAGLIAAAPAVAASASGFTGMAPEARILPVRVSDDAGDVSADLLARGVLAALDGGATVIAVVATAPFGSPALRRAVALAVRRAVVVAPTLTVRDQDGDVAYPAAAPGVLSVLGMAPDGTTPAVRTGRPALSAPGKDLVGLAPSGRGNVIGSGPSLAVAFVAGTAALVRDYRPKLSPAGVRRRLVATADPVAGGATDGTAGRGVVDPVTAVTAVLPAESAERTVPARPRPVVLPVASAVDDRQARVALLAAAGALGVTAVVVVTGATVARGRRRRWSVSAPPT